MKKITSFLLLSLIIVPMFTVALTANAATTNTSTATTDANSLLWGGYSGNIQAKSGLGATDPREMAGSVINIMLGFLGVIAVLIILLGGFKWMTAGGNEDGISEAKQMIGAGVVGLVIILSAFGIAQFVISALYNATGANG